MRSVLENFRSDDAGATAVEYALMASLLRARAGDGS